MVACSSDGPRQGGPEELSPHISRTNLCLASLVCAVTRIERMQQLEFSVHAGACRAAAEGCTPCMALTQSTVRRLTRP